MSEAACFIAIWFVAHYIQMGEGTQAFSLLAAMPSLKKWAFSFFIFREYFVPEPVCHCFEWRGWVWFGFCCGSRRDYWLGNNRGLGLISHFLGIFCFFLFILFAGVWTWAGSRLLAVFEYWHSHSCMFRKWVLGKGWLGWLIDCSAWLIVCYWTWALVTLAWLEIEFWARGSWLGCCLLVLMSVTSVGWEVQSIT